MEAKIYDFLKYRYGSWAMKYVDIFEENDMDITTANVWASDNIPTCHFKDMRPYITEELDRRGYTLSVFE